MQKHYRRAKVEKAVARQEEPAKIDTGSIDKAANPVTSTVPLSAEKNTVIE